MAARVLFRFAPEAACDEVLAALRGRPYGGPALRAALLPLLAEHGEATAVRTLGKELLADPGLVGRELETVVMAWLTVDGREAATVVMEQVRAAVRLTANQSVSLATLLTAEGLPDTAATLWCQVATAPEASAESRWRAVQMLLASGAAVHAEQALRTALVAQHDADEALLLRRLLAWVRPPAERVQTGTAEW
ncbi:hypothetical protein ACIOJD_27345 [Streptomyces sp. NPDC088116]|uniref:hypothetical protein n=1 Tax=Streptomyces sp. NPDC088116 TaxID=3365825 RepID=UPI00381CDAC7